MQEFNKTHHGSMLGVPVWLDMTDEECPGVQAKFGIAGDAALTVVEWLYALFVLLYSWADPFWEPVFPIRIGQEVA